MSTLNAFLIAAGIGGVAWMLGGSPAKIQIVLHSRPWCGHCQRLHQVGSYQSAKTVAEQQSNGQIRFDENTNASPDEMARYGIKGFPTIVAVNTATKELVDTFTGDRNDPKAIVTFALRALHRLR